MMNAERCSELQFTLHRSALVVQTRCAMKLTSQEEYGLRCLLRIARQGQTGALTIPEISEAEGISSHYGAKLMRILRRGGFVTSARGQAGGYTPARPPGRIVVGGGVGRAHVWNSITGQNRMSA